ncbi:oxidoreductase [Kribbella deserti]|uniref:Oxidoreductase n=1 Tax=Kribbella deserti TaxID=1926257 RepID=A0ABV6QE59_9ACTN
MRWSVGLIPDLTGRRALVTGATSGLGYQTALALLRKGAEVVIAGRNPDRVAEAARRLSSETGRQPDVLDLDLADLTSVRAAAEKAIASYEQLDLLINNAGVMATPLRRTADGFELQVGTNHLGHFALTLRLMPLLVKAPGPRVVTVTSFMHRTVPRISEGDLRGEGPYGRWDAYGKSKLANLLFMYELNRRAGDQLTSVGAHPGFAATELQSSGPRLGGANLEARVLSLGTRLVAQSAAAGAWPSLYAATKRDLAPGSLIGPRLMEWRGKPKVVQASRAARDPELARRLWSWSAEATEIDLPTS